PTARVSSGARLGGSVIGAGCQIGEDAVVADSVLWDRVVLEAGAVVRGCVVADGARVREGERLEDAIVVPAARLKGTRAGGRRLDGQRLFDLG
ncbi:MAG TPA: NDP-sugar synthase, partial [Vicinamibacteria bacterium]|nr:NDP-sugar synthase [Vicinamibacteria bacterium]